MKFLMDLFWAVMYGSFIGFGVATGSFLLVFVGIYAALSHTAQIRKAGG